MRDGRLYCPPGLNQLPGSGSRVFQLLGTWDRFRGMVSDVLLRMHGRSRASERDQRRDFQSQSSLVKPIQAQPNLIIPSRIFHRRRSRRRVEADRSISELGPQAVGVSRAL